MFGQYHYSIGYFYIYKLGRLFLHVENIKQNVPNFLSLSIYLCNKPNVAFSLMKSLKVK